jgi:hypothetical protein
VLARLPFLLAAAFIAGGIGDPLVETIADTGIFGAGYHDTNHLGVLPAFLCGLVLTIEIVVLRCVQAVRGDSRTSRERLIAVAERLGARSALRVVPIVVMLQLGVVFAVETVEQVLTTGGVPNGLEWLGGPVAFSLGVHALLALVVTIGLAALTRAIAAILLSLVRLAFAFIALQPVRGGAALLHQRLNGACCRQRRSPRARRIGGRAPPFLFASAS